MFCQNDKMLLVNILNVRVDLVTLRAMFMDESDCSKATTCIAAANGYPFYFYVLWRTVLIEITNSFRRLINYPCSDIDMANCAKKSLRVQILSLSTCLTLGCSYHWPIRLLLSNHVSRCSQWLSISWRRDNYLYSKR